MTGRNSELIRQWTILRELAANRTTTIAKLAREVGRTTRTVRRDLDALQAAGFPLEEEEVNGSKFWRLPAKAMAGLERSGLTFGELSTLYLSRALFECFGQSHLLADLQTALDKVEAALSPAMRTFLDRLPKAISAKSPQPKRHATHTPAITLRLVEAIIERRVVAMKYDSNHSRRLKAYSVHPYRLVHAQDGLYLVAYVPEYQEVRTFAVERIRQAAADKGTFEPVADLGTDPFANSMGVHRGGPTCRVQLKFPASIAARVKERIWHSSQQFKDRADGSTVLTLNVSDDYALRNWILSFGSGVRVLAPASLVEWASEELTAALEQYQRGSGHARPDPDIQPALPFSLGHIASA
jgi:predicted DNA-binding transcriptional regulator YafY